MVQEELDAQAKLMGITNDDYSKLVKDRVKKSVLDGYANTPEFQTSFDATMAQLPTIEKFNEFINASVSIGVSPETAIELYVLTLSMK